MNDRDADTFARFARRFAAIEQMVPDGWTRARARRRRSLAGWVGVVAAGALLVLATVAELAIVPGIARPVAPAAGSPSPVASKAQPSGFPSPTSSDELIAVPTLPPRPSDAPCPAALAHGTLVADARHGVALVVGEEVVPVRWPNGFTARRDGELVVLLDARGEVVAAEGAGLYVGGGFGADGLWLGCGGIEIAGRN